MATNERIDNLVDEIGKEVVYSMNYLKAQLMHESKMTADNLPFLPLYVHFRKNTLEQILLLGYANGDLTEEAVEDLEANGIVYNKKFKTFNFKSLRNFEFDSIKDKHCILDLAALKEYLWTIESWLLGHSQNDLIYQLYFPITVDYKYLHNKAVEPDPEDEPFIKDAPPTAEDIFADMVNEIEELEDERESNWIIYKEEGLEEQDVYCLQDELFYAYYEAHRVLYYPDIDKKWYMPNEDKTPKNRRRILRRIITTDKLGYYLKFINDRVETLIKHNVPNEVIITILENTYRGMRKARINQQLYDYTQYSDRLFNNTTFREALGCGKEKFANYTSRFGEKSFTDEELVAALEKLNLPTDLFVRVDTELDTTEDITEKSTDE